MCLKHMIMSKEQAMGSTEEVVSRVDLVWACRKRPLLKDGGEPVICARVYTLLQSHIHITYFTCALALANIHTMHMFTGA